MLHEASPNHAFLIEQIGALTLAGGRTLDFGCGTGHLVRTARQRGHDVWGCDVYEGVWSGWRDELADDVRPFIRDNSGSKIPYSDHYFETVVSNQVFEHVQPDDLSLLLLEIRRVLKPGGRFLALFPIFETWFEGHVGLYFPHRVRPRALQQAYLQAAHRAGFGYHRGAGQTSSGWAAHFRQTLQRDIVLHRRHDIERLWTEIFDAPPLSLAKEYMRFRLEHSTMRSVAGLTDYRPVAGVAKWICDKRAGLVWLAKAPAQ